MLKRKIDSYIRDYYEITRNALLITGALQIGKTYSIREFGRSFKSFVEINFVDNPDAVDVFKNAKNSADILLRLSAMTTLPLIKGETLIFFDEVQKCPEIVTAIIHILYNQKTDKDMKTLSQKGIIKLFFTGNIRIKLTKEIQ